MLLLKKIHNIGVECMIKPSGGPKLLFLGQKYLEDYSDEYFLKNELNRLFFDEKENRKESLYDFLLKSSLMLKDDEFSWNEFFIKFEELSSQLSISNKLQLLGSVLWNGVVTTSTDGLLDSIFSNGVRNIVNVISDVQRVSNFGSSENLHITKLFGDMQHEDLRIPKNKIEESKFKYEAISILTKFYTPELLTQFGTLFIESYNPITDWINDEMIFPILNKFGQGQVLFFSFEDDFLKSEYIQELVNLGIIIPHKESLSNYLEKVNQNDSDVRDALFFNSYDEGISTIKISKKRVKIPKNIKSSKFKILDDYLNLNPMVEEDKHIDELYKEFHYSSGKNPNWDHFKLNFNIEREFEKEVINTLLKNKKLEFDKKDIVLVKGQNSSGKSISFANIAYRLKTDYDEVVLYIPQISGSLEDFVAIDNFCEWAEQNDSKLVYIFCDCSFDESTIDKYLLLNNYLLERGRNIQIVGTIYNLNDDFLLSWVPNKTFECPILLSNSEKIELIKKINKYSELDNTLEDIEDKNLLVSIYRLLPETRKNIRLGTIREGEYSKNRLTDGIIQESYSNNPFYLFFKSENEEVIANSLKNVDVSRLFELICFVGQYNLNIPIDLLFRTSNHNFTGEIFEILEEIDFFRINALEDGGMSIVIRNTLEAQLLTNSLIPKREDKVKLILDITKNVENKNDYLSKRTEADFLSDLIKKIGPNSSYRGLYKDFYLEISNALEKLRLTGIYNDNLFIQEVSLKREYAKDKNISIDSSIILEQAESILIEKIDESSNMKPATKNIFYNELLSNLGAQIKNQLDSKNYLEARKKIDLFTQIFEKVDISVGASLYSLDILSWTTISVWQSSDSNKNEKIKFAINTLEKLQSGILENPSLFMLPRYHTRILEISELLDNEMISNEEFDKLIEMKDSSGIYLRAIKILDGINLDKPLNKNENDKISGAIKLIENYSEITENNTKCLVLLLKLYWQLYTGYPLFYSEKQDLRFTEDQWENLTKIVTNLRVHDQGYEKSWQMYLEAICLFHQERYKEAMTVFTALRSKRTGGSQRIVIKYLASNPNGVNKYTGRIERVTKDRVYVRINEIQETVAYLDKRYAESEPEINRQLNNLVLGFNYFGVQIIKGAI